MDWNGHKRIVSTNDDDEEENDQPLLQPWQWVLHLGPLFFSGLGSCLEYVEYDEYDMM